MRFISQSFFRLLQKQKAFPYMIGFWCCFQLGFTQPSFSQQSARFTGRIRGDVPCDEIKFIVFEELSRSFKEHVIPVNKKGEFSFTTIPINDLQRIKITTQDYSEVFYDGIVEPGDQINIALRMENNSTTANFTGRGAVKYDLSRRIYNVRMPPSAYSVDQYERKKRIVDSIINLKRSILNAHRSKLTSIAYSAIEADIIGAAVQVWKNKFPYFHANQDSSDRKTLPPSLNDFNSFIKGYDLSSNPLVAYSADYLDFLYYKAQATLTVAAGGNLPNFTDIYQQIKNSYSGLLRDALLMYFMNETLVNNLFNWYGEGVDPEVFKKALEQNALLIKNPSLLKQNNWILGNLAKGAEIRPFTFILDSSSRRVSLAELKDKVVLLDIWAYTCTGCYSFATLFHKYVYPEFASNPNFKVVSVMNRFSNTKEDYLKRLREPVFADRDLWMTFKEYTNLLDDKNKLFEYYKLTGVPAILLLKDGKIYSSSLPLFTELNNGNVEKLKAIIRKALNE